MPQQDALRFIGFVRANSPIQEKINALRGAGALQELARIGRENGFEFTEEEYRAAVSASSNGELTPEALDELSRELFGR